MKYKSANITRATETEWETVGAGVKRQIAVYDDRLMLVKVAFETGAIGTLHRHPHTQASYVASGRFELQNDGTQTILETGDCFRIDPDAEHGVLCLEAGVLIDTFSPIREDFLKR